MPIAFNAAADLGNNGGTSNNLTASYTVGSGLNRLLVVAVSGDVFGGADDVSVTYAGQAMTLGAKNTGAGATYPGSDRMLYAFFLLNPPSGSNTVVVSAASTHYLLAVAADYSGVAQSGQPDASATGIAANSGTIVTLTTNITTIAANDWIIGIGSGTSAAHPYTSDDLTLRVAGAAYSDPILFDSNAGVAAGSQTTHMTLDDTGGGDLDLLSVILAFSPASSIVALSATASGMGMARPQVAAINSVVARGSGRSAGGAAGYWPSLLAMDGLALGFAGATPGGTAALYGMAAARSQGRGFLASGALVMLHALGRAMSAMGMGPGFYGASMTGRGNAQASAAPILHGTTALVGRATGAGAGRGPGHLGSVALIGRSAMMLAGRASAGFGAILVGLAGRAQGNSGGRGGMTATTALAARSGAGSRATGFLGSGIALPLRALGRGASALGGVLAGRAALSAHASAQATAAPQPRAIVRLQGTAQEIQRAAADPAFYARLEARNTLTLTVMAPPQARTELAATARQGAFARAAAAFTAEMQARSAARGSGEAQPSAGAALSGRVSGAGPGRVPSLVLTLALSGRALFAASKRAAATILAGHAPRRPLLINPDLEIVATETPPKILTSTDGPQQG